MCTDSACSSNANILQCTQAALPECYKWIIVYSKTVMTQHGCAATGFRSTAMHTAGALASSIAPELLRTVTVTEVPWTASTPTLGPVSSPSKPNLGAVIGGTIGGCTIISLIVVAVLVARRHGNAAQSSVGEVHVARYHGGGASVTEYNAHGFTSAAYPSEAKTWMRPYAGPVPRASDAMPPYPGMAARQYGIVQVDGVQRAVEAPAEVPDARQS
ncbi:hypothetical protein ACEQ8H_003563 [Pleosporales sp. CAS-2024a]